MNTPASHRRRQVRKQRSWPLTFTATMGVVDFPGVEAEGAEAVVEVFGEVEEPRAALRFGLEDVKGGQCGGHAGGGGRRREDRGRGVVAQ
ncbi:hypothetical protein ACQEVM_17620 [Streptomyces sp. CA-243310]|uniref:hypothetical protein n=1 Tax=Streptomyces sp. CA-243310 TaxID=3240056 RepID=UPI003D8C4FE9